MPTTGLFEPTGRNQQALGPQHTGEVQGSFENLVEGFNSSLQELRTISMLRLEDSAIGLFDQDLRALQKTVRALEDKLEDINAFVTQEKQAVKKVERMLGDCDIQTQHLDFISSHLPQRLPQQPIATANSQSNHSSYGRASDSLHHAADNKDHEGNEASTTCVDRRKKPLQAPRRYISETEYGALSTYMTQRLPLSKVNTAVEDAADLAESNMKMLAHARAGGKMPTAEWKRAQALLVNIANKDVVKGRCWITDSDLKKSALLKPDKTGKAIITILRHLGRIQEARLLLDGKLESVYVLLPSEGA